MAAEPSTAIVPLRDTPKQPERLALAPFGTWDYKEAADAVKAGLPGNYDQLKAYCASQDHWQDGREWVGPGDATNRGNQSQQIKRQFAPYDAIGKALANLANAFALEAEINTAPVEEYEAGKIPAEVTKKMAEADQLLTLLFDRHHVHKHHRPCVRISAYAGRAGLRWWIPPGFAWRMPNGEVRLRETKDFTEAAEWLALERPDPAAAAVIVHKETQERAAVCLSTIREGGKDVAIAEIAYVDGEETVFRVVYADKREAEEPYRLKMGGLLPFSEMDTGLLITEPVIAGQRQANFAKSLISRSLETCGFPERVISNAKPAGERREYNAGDIIPSGAFLERDETGREWLVIPEIRTLGSNTTTELVGLDTTGADGKQGHETPGYERFDPVVPEHAIQGKDEAFADVLRMCGQGHLAGDSTAEASGAAYEQHRAEFMTEAESRRGPAEGMLRDSLTSVLAQIEALAGQPGYFTQTLRVVVTIHVNVGPASPQARTEDREAVKAGLMAPETAMARAGIEDLKNELQRIRAHPFYKLILLEKVAAVFNTLSGTTSAPAVVRALIAAGVEPEIVEALQPKDTDYAGVEQ